MQMPLQHLTWGWVEHIYLEIVSAEGSLTDVYMFRRTYHLFYFQYVFFYFFNELIGHNQTKRSVHLVSWISQARISKSNLFVLHC